MKINTSSLILKGIFVILKQEPEMVVKCYLGNKNISQKFDFKTTNWSYKPYCGGDVTLPSTLSMCLNSGDKTLSKHTDGEI